MNDWGKNITRILKATLGNVVDKSSVVVGVVGGKSVGLYSLKTSKSRVSTPLALHATPKGLPHTCWHTMQTCLAAQQSDSFS